MKTCILTVLGINFEEKYGLGKVLILIVFGHWAKTFCPESNMLLAGKWKFHSTCGEVHFRGTHFQKIVSSTFFPEFEQKIVKRPTILFRRNCKSCNLRFRMNNVGEYLFWNFFSAHCFSGFWKKRFSNFNQNVSAGLWKLHFFVTRGTFSMKIFSIEFTKLYS